MSDVRVGVKQWAFDHEAEPGEDSNVEIGFAWVQIGDHVLDASNDCIVSVEWKSEGGDASVVTITLSPTSFATVDHREKRRDRRGRWRRR